MKILITGGAGYKGIKLTAKLLAKGYKVTVLDNFMYGFDPFLFLAENKNLEVKKQDIRNDIKDLHTFDVIFHLAGISGLPACAANPHSARVINVDATKKLVEGLGTGQLIINASTTSFYGKLGTICDEETPIEAISWYGITKYEAEQIVLQKENSISLRFATVFGFSPKMRMDLMVNDFVYRAIKEGMIVLFNSYAKRTFIHIDDAIDCYIFAMENADRMRGSVFNAGGEDLNYSKKEIAEIVNNFIPVKIIDTDTQDKDLRNFITSFKKIEGVGFKPNKTIEDGINELIRVFSFYDYYSHYKTI